MREIRSTVCAEYSTPVIGSSLIGNEPASTHFAVAHLDLPGTGNGQTGAIDGRLDYVRRSTLGCVTAVTTSPIARSRAAASDHRDTVVRREPDDWA